ncbi:hypothetical protein HD596_011297 [Nonomuraea jabiensis]|uniref:Uncharacterized protein n=1 Tax=Nonomuraea jabiensis TaxID=882448 RepID=A0A7W9LHZ4_9ACTN|nr:hypothetical protein [Nonomuraea jabiensis]
MNATFAVVMRLRDKTLPDGTDVSGGVLVCRLTA